MQQRVVNQEMNTDIFMRLLGMPDQALLLVGGVLVLSILAGGFLRGFPCGLTFARERNSTQPNSPILKI